MGCCKTKKCGKCYKCCYNPCAPCVPAGPTGPAGAAGPTGATGAVGLTGATGAAEFTGSNLFWASSVAAGTVLVPTFMNWSATTTSPLLGSIEISQFGTVDNMYVTLNNTLTSASITFTSQLNNSELAGYPEVTILLGSSSGNDPVGSFDVEPGDRVGVRVSGTLITPALDVAVGLRFTPTEGP